MKRSVWRVEVPGGIAIEVTREPNGELIAIDMRVDGRLRAGVYMLKPHIEKLIVALTEARDGVEREGPPT